MWAVKGGASDLNPSSPTITASSVHRVVHVCRDLTISINSGLARLVLKSVFIESKFIFIKGH